MQRTGCAIVGGGPAGLMLGLLLARAGVEVTVVEKHGDFLRDFRGDTVHPSTVRLMDELGLGEAFRKIPQSRLRQVAFPAPGGGRIVLGDFDLLPRPYNYVAMMPQWDFLNLLAEAASREPNFTLLMNAEATGLVCDGGRVTGVQYRIRRGRTDDHSPDARTADARSDNQAEAAGSENRELHADLVVACDGRHSVLRRSAGLQPREYRVPFDTWWFRLPRHDEEQGDIAGIMPAFQGREVLIALLRTDYYQLGYLARKGSDARLRSEGVERFRQRVARLRPDFADRVDLIRSMDDLHMLDVKLNRLRHWYVDGLLCIGDAAHAMSPAGGVGINLAIQDAVAAGALLAAPLRRRQVTERDLAKVQRRRQLPTVIVQTAQRFLHRVVFVPVFEGRRAGAPKAVLFLARHLPGFRKVPPRMIGFGPRPEHAPAFARR